MICSVELFFDRLAVQVSLVGQPYIHWRVFRRKSNSEEQPKLTVNSLQLLGDIDSKLTVDHIPRFNSSILRADAPFRSLSEAREAILDITRQAILDLRINYLADPDASMPNLPFINSQLARWSQAFDSFVQEQRNSPDSIGPAGRRGIALLDLHRRYLNIYLAVSSPTHPRGPDMWDIHTREFEDLINCAARAMQPTGPGTQSGSSSAQQQQPQFHMDLGAVPILFSTVLKCRDKRLRKRAIALMRENETQEGVWNSVLTARVAERAVELEDRGKDRAVDPGAAEVRIRGVSAFMQSQEKSVTILYEFPCSSKREVISW